MDTLYAVFEFVVEPRNGVVMHVHDNEEEHFIVVEGRMHMVNGDRALDATVGTSVTIGKGVPHAWCNLSDSPARMLVIFTPVKIEQLFREAVGANDGDLKALARTYGTRFVGPPLVDGLDTIASLRPSATRTLARGRS